MVGDLRLLQAVEHDPAAFYGERLGAPDLVNAFFGSRVRGIPPAVNGLHDGIALVPLLCQTIGILPAAAQNEVVALTPHIGFAVEISQQKGGLFAPAACDSFSHWAAKGSSSSFHQPRCTA